MAELFANDGVTSISMVFHGDCIYAYDHLGHTASDEVGKEVIKKIDLKTDNQKKHFHMKAKMLLYQSKKFWG
ncbi:MAG: hypothetical protein ACLRMX_03385 [Lachnospira eligens]